MAETKILDPKSTAGQDLYSSTDPTAFFISRSHEGLLGINGIDPDMVVKLLEIAGLCQLPDWYDNKEINHAKVEEALEHRIDHLMQIGPRDYRKHREHQIESLEDYAEEQPEACEGNQTEPVFC